ncbi:histidine kinase [Lachnospiraceae bacterium OttesenSCG-928-D06]|nr:histidine kinase [Lachnospiraceae bacterium OttesenSCG-928-D06]
MENDRMENNRMENNGMLKNRKQKHRSIKWKVTGFLLAGWFVPAILTILVFFYYLTSHHYDSVTENLVTQLKFNNELCVERIDNCITRSRKASYDNTILDAYIGYKNGKYTYYGQNLRVSNYIEREYGTDINFMTVFVWSNSEPEEINYSTYNTSGGGMYIQVQTFWQEDFLTISDFAESLDTKTGFMQIKNRLYMVRNLMDNTYHPVGTLVMRLNADYLFGSLEGMPWAEAVQIEFADYTIEWAGNQIHINEREDEKILREKGVLHLGKETYVHDSMKGDGYFLNAIMRVNRNVLTGPFYGYPYVFGGMILCLIPLLVLFLRMFRTQVTDPVDQMVNAFEKLVKGHLGYQMETTVQGKEFAYLIDSFNDVSKQLKVQFDRIYEEEIMVRDARIMALQSSINPHFMNNTLEIINWEARMAGDLKVSKMIEALSTLMDAAIDRKKRPVVRLYDEMLYVNSYLYIISERLGQRLKIEKEIPQEILDLYVPRLILQPIIENAVEHGIVPNREGTIVIRGEKDERFLYLKIINDGKMTENQRKQIDILLETQPEFGKANAENMGIANVHQRLQMLYGESSGLSIESLDDTHVQACLTIDLTYFVEKTDK